MKRLACLLALILWPGLAPAWDLDAAASAVRVVSVKNREIAETHRFTDLTGAVAENGLALVAVGLGSIDTGIEIRDERMRTMLFDLDAHPFALVSAQIDLPALAGLETGASQALETPLVIEANGQRLEMTAALTVTRLGPDRVMVRTAAPLILHAGAFGFTAGLDSLRAIAGLDAIALTVPVSADLVFVQ